MQIMIFTHTDTLCARLYLRLRSSTFPMSLGGMKVTHQDTGLGNIQITEMALLTAVAIQGFSILVCCYRSTHSQPKWYHTSWKAVTTPILRI